LAGERRWIFWSLPNRIRAFRSVEKAV
jgi:hypothetical protein